MDTFAAAIARSAPTPKRRRGRPRKSASGPSDEDLRRIESDQEGAEAASLSTDVQTMYWREAARHSFLSPGEEQALGRRIQQGDLDARNTLVERNLRLVISIARRYQRDGVALLDIVQEGNLGLMIAAEKFDPERGFRFSTYATWWIRQSIHRMFPDKELTIRVPVYAYELSIRIIRMREKLRRERHGRHPSVSEIAIAMGTPEHAIVKHIDAIASMSSLDGSPSWRGNNGTGDDEMQLHNFVASPHALGGSLRADAIEWMNVHADLLQDICEIVQRIDDASESPTWECFSLFYGFDRRFEPRTLQAVADQLGITRERVRQIINDIWHGRGRIHARFGVDHKSFRKLLRDFLPLLELVLATE